MKMNDYSTDIRSIADKVKIVDDETYAIMDQVFPVRQTQAYTKWTQPLNSFGSNTGDTQQMKVNLRKQLIDALYSNFYCRDSVEAIRKADKKTEPKINDVEHKKTIAILSQLNATTDRTDTFWKVYSIDPNGTCYVQKNGEVRCLMPNEWEFSDKNETHLKIGSVVHLKIKREDTAIQSVFYHVKSRELISQQAELIRIYFNTTFEGAYVLVKEITTIFNHYRMPFMFKCLNHPDLFTRADSAVLYLDKSQFFFGSKLLSMILPKFRPLLKNEVPLFTYKLLPGLSFSEDPGNNQSFGMHCCSLLADGIINAFEKELDSDDKKYSEILKTFQRNGVDINKIYLKPNSKFPYDFSMLSDKAKH